MGDASSVKLAISEETTFGTNPGSGFLFYRFNSESLGLDQGNVQSGEIDPNRQPAANIRTNLNASGGITAEDSLITPAATPTGFDLLLEGACMNDFSAIVGNTSTIDISGVSGGTFTLTDVSTGAAFTSVSVGDWIKVSGYSTNGTIYARVTTVTSVNSVDCEGVRSTDAAVTNESGGIGAITVAGSTLTIGTTKKSYTIERQYTDLTTPEYTLYTGMRVNRWSMRLNPQAIFEHTFDFLGSLQDTTTSSGAGTPTAKWATSQIESVDHFKMKMLDDFETVSTVRISEINFELNNNLRTEPELGVLGSQDIGISTPTLSGTIRAFMSNADLIRLAEDGTRSQAAFRLDDGTRQRIIGFNSILFGRPDAAAQGNDQSILVNLPFSAEADSDGIAFTISRF